MDRRLDRASEDERAVMETTETTSTTKRRSLSSKEGGAEVQASVETKPEKPEEDPALVFDFANDQVIHDILVAVAGITAIGVGPQNLVPVPPAVANNPAQSAVAFKNWLDALATQCGLTAAANFTHDYRGNCCLGMFHGLGGGTSPTDSRRWCRVTAGLR